MTRSSRLLTVGIAVILLGLVVLVITMMNGGREPITVSEGAASSNDVSTSSDALPTSEDADAAVAATDFEEIERLPLPLEIPEGFEAVSVSVGYSASVAAIPVPGDRVNVYGVFAEVPDALLTPEEAAEIEAKEAQNLPVSNPAGVVRALSSVEVLGVTGTLPNAGGGELTLVLALEPDDVEKAVYLTAHESIWFSLVNEDDEPVDGVGVTRETVLD